jgi:tetratricopeptide (TPR) repeat protein/DNA-binding SARP family transcriptional activator
MVGVSQLRKALSTAGVAREDAELVRKGSGYVLRTDPLSVDAHRFRALVDRARAVADADRITLLGEALRLWTGPVLDGAAPAATRDRLCRGLDEARLAAVEDRLDAKLRCGLHRDVLGELPGLVDAHPLRERLVAQFMLALYRDGRAGEALALYRDARDRLATDLGLDPGPDLRALERAILRDDPAIAAPAPTIAAQALTVAAASTGPVPAQLPLAAAGFVGRTAELEWLDAVAGDPDQVPAGAPVVISAIAGTAGVGKTSLAVHWAHRSVGRFPDGQLYVNLRGFDPTGPAMTAAEAVRGFLDALGVAAQRVPATLDAQAALYRSLIAGRQMLVLLDNARDADQIRPLLPGSPSTLVVVTSRNRLSSLVAVEGARPLTLGLLSADEARDLLARRLGPGRLATEPQAVDDIITLCARLPLALAIVAARAVAHPSLSLRALATGLHDTLDRLDSLTGEDPVTDIRAVFSWSYHALSPAAARLFRLLGLHPGPDISAAAAASLGGQPLRDVRATLAELSRAHLVVEHVPGRYTLHDLLRAYAGELAHTHDPDDERQQAIHRTLDHYLHTANAADRLLYPARDSLTLTALRPGTTPQHLANHQQALEWFAAEYPVLLAAVDHAAATGFDTHTWQLAWTLASFLERRGHWHDWVAAGRAAVAAAGRLADLPAQAGAHRILAGAYTRLGRFGDAHTQLRHALDVAALVGEPAGQAHTYRNLAYVQERQGRHAEALDHARRALDLYRAAGHRHGEARALNNIGWLHVLLGDHRQALTCCQQAIALHQELGNRLGQADTWDSVGYAHHHLGQHTEAIDCYQHAVNLYRDLGNRHGEAETLIHLGDSHHAAGNPEAAREAWQHALTIFDQLDHPDAELVRAKVHRVPARITRAG